MRMLLTGGCWGGGGTPTPLPPFHTLLLHLQRPAGTGPSSSHGVAVKIVKAKHRHRPPNRRLTSVRVRSCDPGWTKGRFGKGLDMLEALGQQRVANCVFRSLTGRAVLAQPWKQSPAADPGAPR